MLLNRSVPAWVLRKCLVHAVSIQVCGAKQRPLFVLVALHILPRKPGTGRQLKSKQNFDLPTLPEPSEPLDVIWDTWHADTTAPASLPVVSTPTKPLNKLNLRSLMDEWDTKVLGSPSWASQLGFGVSSSCLLMNRVRARFYQGLHTCSKEGKGECTWKWIRSCSFDNFK